MTYDEIMREWKEANRAASEAVDAYCSATLDKDKTIREKEYLFERAERAIGYADGIGHIVQKYF